MRISLYVTLIACIALILLPANIALWGAPAKAQEPDPAATWLTLVNETRLDEGRAPYSVSRLLSVAAQRHADDIAANGFTDPDDVHLGSDGTHEQERITEAGYEAWNRNGGGLAVDENLWTGRGTPEDALTFFLEDPVHRDNILSDVYREIGIGVVTDTDGRNYYVLDFGARPNVLPVFINDGATTTDSPEVAIRLTNEEVRPEGEGTEAIGKAIEIRLSNEPAFDDQPWQRWSELVPWTLPDTPGQHTVYVQFRDAADRVTDSADSIIFSEGTPATPSMTPEATTTPSPSPTLTPTDTATPTPVPTDTPSLPSPSPSPPTPTSSPLPPSPSPLPPTETPFPTWTPLPSPSSAEGTHTGLEGQGSGSLIEEPVLRMSGYSPLLGVVAVLQGMALALGLYLTLRRDGT